MEMIVIPNLIDETGNKYGRLTVIKRDGKSSPTKWICQCECGNVCSVLGTQLRNGVTNSCGCLKHDRIVESNKNRAKKDIKSGDIYGELTILEKVGSNNKGTVWKCQCSCGKIIYKNRIDIKRAKHPSCGCYLKDPFNNYNFINEIGNKHGKLTVIEYAGRNSDNKTLWKCKCDCGGIIVTTGKSLRAGLTTSCGCIKSLGEEKINKILQDLNINFETQKTFKNLKSDNNYLLYLDFYLPKYNLAIEYQGIQHYKSIKGYFDEDQLQKLKRRDQIKREYCKQNNIKLVEIPYTDFDKIDNNYIQEVVLGD